VVSYGGVFPINIKHVVEKFRYIVGNNFQVITSDVVKYGVNDFLLKLSILKS
jgi:hypothetical protein